MTFKNEMLRNCVYNDQPLMFNPVLKERIGGMGGPEIETGALVQENGDILFRIYAPNAASVEIKIMGQAGCDVKCVLKKGEDGVFEGLYQYNEIFCGPHSVDVLVDGMCIIYPYIPVMWHRNRPANFIEVLDAETTYINVNHVPHGSIAREIYWSETTNSWQRCLVYLPPCYHEGGTYPVLYLQHGATENETCWEYNGRVGYIMDNLIAENKALPFIIVMNDGMVRDPNGKSQGIHTFDCFEKSLLESCVPFIESRYRVKTDKWSRAIAGLSMGSIQSVAFALKHSELFGYLGVFSGSLTHPEIDPQISQKAFDKEFISSNFKVFFRSIGDSENLLDRYYQDSERCKTSGITDIEAYHSRMYRYQTHEWGAWRRAFYDFAQLIFRT